MAPTSLSSPILSPGPRLSSPATLMSQGDAFTSILKLHVSLPPPGKLSALSTKEPRPRRGVTSLITHLTLACPPQGGPGQGPVLLLVVPTTCSTQPRARLRADTPRRVGTDPIYKGPGHLLPHPAPSRGFPAHLEQDPRPRCGTKAPVIWIRLSSLTPHSPTPLSAHCSGATQSSGNTPCILLSGPSYLLLLSDALPAEAAGFVPAHSLLLWLK